MISVPMNAILIALTLFLQAAAPASNGAIAGQLRIEGAVAPGVRVAVLNESGGQVALSTADATGRYRLENIPPGKYLVTAGLQEFPTYYPGVLTRVAAVPVTVAAGTAVTADFAVVTPVGVKVRGRVERPVDQPGNVSGLRLTIGQQYSSVLTVATAADGTFEFSGVAAGPVLLRTSLDSPPVTLSLVVGEKDLDGIRVVLPRTVTIPVLVTVEGNGPLPRLSFASTAAADRNLSNGYPTRTGALSLVLPEGRQYLSVNGLPPGYFVRALRYGTSDLLREPLDALASSNATIQMTLGTAEPPPWFSIRGRVSGASVEVVAIGDGGNTQVTTPVNPDGSFELRKLLPGRYLLRPDSTGNAPGVAVDVVNKDVDGIELNLRRRVPVLVRIVTEGGGPATRVTLTFIDRHGGFAVSAPPVAPDGSATVTLSEGEYRVDVTGVPQGYTLKSMTQGTRNVLTSWLRIDSSTTPEIVVTLAGTQGTRKVAGRILGVTNQNLGAARVVLSRLGLQDVSASIGTDGAFSFPNITEGTYALELRPAVPGVLSQALRVGAQDISNVEIRVPRLASVSGQIAVDGGGPLPPFPIRLTGGPGSFFAGSRDAQGNFSFSLPEGDYELKFDSNSGMVSNGPTSLAPNYRVKSIVSAGAPVDPRVIRVSAANAQRLIVTLETKAYKVSGRVTGMASLVPNGRQGAGPSLVLRPADQRSGLPGFAMDLPADGSFAFDKVPPGNYVPRVAPDVVGFVPDEIRVVDRDVAGVEVRLPTVVEVRGRVVLEPGMPMPRFGFESLVGGGRIALGPPSMDAGGAFTMRLPEGELRLGVAGISPGFQLKAAAYGATDLLSSPARISGAGNQTLVLTFGYAGTWHRVAGRVVGADIIADPLWRGVQLSSFYVGPFEAQPAPDGSFVFPSVPPGSYTLRVNVPSNMATVTPLAIVVDRDMENLQLRVAPPAPR